MKIRRAQALGALPVAVLLAAAAPACAPMGVLGDVGSPSSQMFGEVRSVDRSRGRIQIQEQYGRNQTLRIDNRTQVVYRNRQYPVSSLQRGDQVRVRVSHDRNNNLWADRIEVRESYNDRRGGTVGRVERVSGSIRSIDQRRGVFTIDRGRNQRVTVYLTNNTRRDDVRRFDRLRRGDRVSAEIRYRSGSTAELLRFR